MYLARPVIVFLAVLLTVAQSAADQAMRSPLDSMAQELASILSRNLSIPNAALPKTLIVNLVDSSQLHCTSRFGRLLPERIGLYLQEKGWKIVEFRRGRTMKLETDVGPFILSEELKDIAEEVECQAVLTGTYTYYMGNVMVSLRLVRLPDNEVISSAGTERVADPWISTLLTPRGFGCKNPRAFLKVRPWKDELSHEPSRFSEKEEMIDESL